MANPAAPMSMAIEPANIADRYPGADPLDILHQVMLQLTAKRMRLEIHRDCRSPRFIEKYWLAPRYCGLFWLRLKIFSNWRSGNLSSRHHVRHWQLRLSWIGKHCCSRYSTHIGDLIVARTNVHWSMPPIVSIDTCASYDWVRPIGMVVCQPLLQSIVPRWASRSLWIERPCLSQIAWHWFIGY